MLSSHPYLGLQIERSFQICRKNIAFRILAMYSKFSANLIPINKLIKFCRRVGMLGLIGLCKIFHPALGSFPLVLRFVLRQKCQ